MGERGLELFGGLSIVRKDVVAGEQASRQFLRSFFLTSLREREYDSFVMGGSNSEYIARERHATQKKKLLFLNEK
jgi:hypothetical protein